LSGRDFVDKLYTVIHFFGAIFVAESAGTKRSIDSVVSLKNLRKGLAIYKTGRSPFWYIRLRDPLTSKYVVRSSKETSRLEAIETAHEFADSYRSKANSELAQTKATSFEHYAKLVLAAQKTKTEWSHRDNRILTRQKDGLIAYFGKHDVTKITAGMVREYLAKLDQSRAKPLADSTKAKHVILIRKVLTMAVEDGLMHTLPPMPKAKTVDTPRHAFTDEEYVRFSKAALECAKRGVVVRGVKITDHHAKMFKFVVQSFLRPTVGELFGLKHKDITVYSEQGPTRYLELNVRGGKTGHRVSVTLSLAVALYGSTLDPLRRTVPDPEDYVWMPEYPNRTTAINTARRLFNHILGEAGLADPDRKLHPYSLRHYALQARLRSSHGRANIHTLAKNAGTSTDQLERFYLKRMPPTKEMIENLQYRPETPRSEVLKPSHHRLSLDDWDHLEGESGEDDSQEDFGAE
jgi:integrase